ncbi:MAG: alanine racemase, partial [Muribaculum sp.]|nr:alanine racemase [Muribaculum sp.]
TVGVMTSLGHDHDAGFVSLEEKCREKVRLFRQVRAVAYGGDDSIVDRVIRDMLPMAVRYVWSEADRDATVYVASRVSVDRKTTSLSLIIDGGRFDVVLPFSAAHLVDDALTVLVAQIALGVSPAKAVASLETLTGVATRLSVIEGVNHCLLVFDQNRSSDYHALSTAMDFVAPRLTPGLSLTVIIGDMAHETMSEQQLYSAVGRLLLSRGVGRIIGCGTELMHNRSSFDGLNTLLYGSADEMIAGLSTSDFNNQLVLICGSDNDHFERLLPMLEARSHETVLEVNLDALVHNFNYFRSKLRPETGIICMVKASGYGAGSYELAKTLQAQGAAYLAVAVVDEGVELRQRGITMPVMVMNPKVTNYPALFANRLEPEIYSFDILREIISQGARCGISGYPVHIKIDSGMHRLGFTIEEIPDVIDMLRGQSVVVPSSVFSHLAAADMPAEDDYTMAQFDYFDRCAHMLITAFPEHNIKRHILNSTGILRFPERQYDMVRLGIGLYGVPTIPGDPLQAPLQPVSSLRTVVISVKQWPAGTTVGYSRRGVLSRDSRIATLPIGYADGLDRQLGYGNASFVIRGHRCPTVGSICMDLCMVDVTDCPEVTVGDSVEIFGREVTAVELGDILDSIPYEVLTSVSQRVKRVYYRE